MPKAQTTPEQTDPAPLTVAPDAPKAGPHLAPAHESVKDGDFPDAPLHQVLESRFFPEALYPEMYVEGEFTPNATNRPAAGVTTADGTPVEFEEG